MATSLPPFIELMASLGLDHDKISDRPINSPHHSPSPSPHEVPLRARATSIKSLGDSDPIRHRVTRYSPYSPAFSTTRRRGSVSSVSSGGSSLRSHSSSPRPSPRLSRRSINNLSINVYDSTPDLGVNTPISAYLRRKTPGLSPTSPSFPPERKCKSRSASPLAFTVPTLPTLYHHFPSSGSSFALSSDSESDVSLNVEPEPEKDIMGTARRRRPRSGTRLSHSTRTVDGHKNLLRSRSYAQLA